MIRNQGNQQLAPENWCFGDIPFLLGPGLFVYIGLLAVSVMTDLFGSWKSKGPSGPLQCQPPPRNSWDYF